MGLFFFIGRIGQNQDGNSFWRYDLVWPDWPAFLWPAKAVGSLRPLSPAVLPVWRYRFSCIAAWPVYIFLSLNFLLFLLLWRSYLQCGNLVVPRTRRRIGDRTFSIAAPRAWNRLPTELKLLRSTDLFRRDLKTFLFHSVYGHQDTDQLCDAPSVF